MQELLPKFDLYAPITYVFFTFCFFVLIQLTYVLFIFGRLAFHRIKKEKNGNGTPGLSVVIAARNESENLYKFLPFILEQDYPNFEVIVINHQSVDDSKYVLDAYQQQYSNLRVIKIERNKHLKYGKKLPLTLGIKAANNEHLIFTDADCKPSSDQWLHSMAARFSNKKKIVLGYGPVYKRKGFANRLMRFDTAWIGMSYLSMAKARFPYMGIGRNLAYTRDTFTSVNGFKSHYALASGDDDLFIQEAAKKQNYTINIEPESFCYSKAPKTLKKWTRQKARHYTTASKYKVIKKLLLGIYPLSLLFMLISFVSLCLVYEYLWVSLAIFVFLIAVKWIVFGKAFRKIKENSFVAWLPFWDVFYAIWTPIMFYTVSKTEADKW